MFFRGNYRARIPLIPLFPKDSVLCDRSWLGTPLADGSAKMGRSLPLGALLRSRQRRKFPCNCAILGKSVLKKIFDFFGRQPIAQNSSVASTMAAAISDVAGEWAELGTTTNLAAGHARESSHAVTTGASRSSRPWIITQGMPSSRWMSLNIRPSSSQPRLWK